MQTSSIPEPPVRVAPVRLDPETRAAALRKITKVEQALRAAKLSLMPSGVKPANRDEAKQALWAARAELEGFVL